VTAPTPKDLAVSLARTALRSFLDTGCHLDCAPSAPPEVSVLLLLCNRAELTLGCLQTLALRLNQVPFEIVVIDNGSTDDTRQLLERVSGLKVVRNEANLGYPRAVNQAARLAAGKFLLLLNNDTQVLGRGIDVAAAYLEANPDVGAVGGKVILLDGALQEAGCTIWRNGWTCQYGRHQAPDGPAYDFQREVDYCSGAFLMTPRELFASFGGLDEAFSPGYFEDLDYCLRLWQAGRRVVYLPDAAILHYENGTSSTLSNFMELVQRNHALFTSKWAEWLSNRPTATWPSVLARTANNFRFTVLLLGDDLVEGLSAERAFSALHEWIARIEALDGFVTLGLAAENAARLRPLLRRLPRTTELFYPEKAEQSLTSLAANYDLVVAGDVAALGPLVARSSVSPRCAIRRDGRLVLLGAPASSDLSSLPRKAA
jgi:O-antigen biosynthesis protein